MRYFIILQLLFPFYCFSFDSKEVFYEVCDMWESASEIQKKYKISDNEYWFHKGQMEAYDNVLIFITKKNFIEVKPN